MSPRWGFKAGFILFSIHMSPRWGYESGKMPRLRFLSVFCTFFLHEPRAKVGWKPDLPGYNGDFFIG